MSEEKPQGVVRAPVWGIFLLFLGVVLLLQTLDVLSWSLWRTLWRFWPVLIIIIGLGILLRRHNVWLVSLLILAILGACLGIAVWQHKSSPPAGVSAKSYSEPLAGMERARVDMDFSVGTFTVSSLPSGSSNLVEAKSDVGGNGGTRLVDFQRQGNEGRLHLSTAKINRHFWDDDGFRLEVGFARNIPLVMDVRAVASNLDLRLGELKVTELRLDLDAGNCKVMMPASAGTIYAYIDVDVGNVEVTVPDGVAVKFKADVDAGNLQVDGNRFPQEGDYYISRDFESAENRIELEIDCDVGRVQVN